ncbi:MAG: HAD-IC family P-type ATPase, partial [Bacillota bacterium]
MKSSFFEKKLINDAVISSFSKLDPRVQWKNPVMFVTWVAAVIVTVITFVNVYSNQAFSFELQISLWLWFTVLFANFSEALAEGRGKAQAESLRKARTQSVARLVLNGNEASVAATELRRGNIVVCESGDIIPGDGEVIEGIATVDESAITGESAPVIRESGGDRSAVTGGTRVISDRILVKIMADPGQSFLDRMISLVEGATRQKTPNEIALGILLIALTVIFVFAVLTLKYFAEFSAKAANQDLSGVVTIPVLIALLVCLIPTTIGGLLSAIGISGMDRLVRKNVIGKSGRVVEEVG